ncbi:acyltransferase family protein [Allorhizobium taibaishanense]|uniref:Peptidoglycan/LPS O-acetylase OafA/YrhL n=1 Tax=Allorhizobium taibaishanense TaxID=887144 RepID=A0A1Q9A879_9HYPH|nr:acyltransferase [Allorhizobium taibaishanense]MBB4009701.1 peptidoglycan/LPS O-acetylase OafA/YrhL [Allorhizobium taibaishanense]OLP50792.1 hypothetical protein BJF91_05945 [Allorhizobium taibaishanense]
MTHQEGHVRPQIGMLPSLQILRFIAAFSVVLYHAGSGLAVEYGGINNPFFFGTMGVDIFFILSGFIISYSTDASRGIGHFLHRRFARVVPLYWLLTLAIILVALIKPNMLNSTVVTVETVVKSFLFIPFPKPNGTLQPLLFLGWTLCYEIFFYCLYALCMLWRGKADILCPLILVALVTMHEIWPHGSMLWHFYFNPVLIEFALGIALCQIYRRSAFFQAGSDAIAVLLVGAACLLYWLVSNLPVHQVVAPSIFSTLVVSGFLFWRSPKGAIASLLVMLGNASYSLYLIHPYFIQAAIKIFGKMMGTVALTAAVAVTVALTILLSVLIFRLIEKPLQKVVLKIGKTPMTKPEMGTATGI